MKRALFLALSLLAASSSCAETNDRPNVLVIISDDQGHGDFGFTGNTVVRTPNLDRLAAESALFRDFTVAAACSPTRAALFTGRDHLLTGVWGVPPRANLRPDETRMPAFFKAAGYRTLHIGKLDCAKMGRSEPTAFGWDDYVGGGGYEHKDPMLWKPKNSERGRGWAADLWTDCALQFMRDNRDRPWFATVAYIIPHLPWLCPEEYSQPFLARGCSTNLAACYGSIAHLDASIGRLLEGLRETGQERRTIVVFLSDNGPTSPEVKQGDDEGGVPGDDWTVRNVARLRGHKAMVYENGTRVPLLVRWPGRIKPGERRQYAAVEDVLPTLLDLSEVGAEHTKHQPFTGVTLRRPLEDAQALIEHPAVLRMAIAGPGAPRDGAAHTAAELHLTLRDGRYKWHARPGGRAALYDILADPGENLDVQAKYPMVAERLQTILHNRWQALLDGGRAFAPAPNTGRHVKTEE